MTELIGNACAESKLTVYSGGARGVDKTAMGAALAAGGTAAGLVPVFVVDGPDVLEGNKLLIQHGAIPFPAEFDDSPSSLGDWLEDHAAPRDPIGTQGRLF